MTNRQSNRCDFLKGAVLAVTALLLPGSAARCDEEKKQPVSAAPLENFEIRNIEGWVVYISKRDLADQADGMKQVLEHLRSQLYQVRITLPGPAVAIMQDRVPLWVEWDTGPGTACHPSYKWLLHRGYPSPAGLKTLVSFTRAKGFCRSALHQPWVVCHELAHGYDYLYLGEGKHYSNQRLRDAYERLKKSGIYESVLCRYSPSTKHYALSNPMEYFTESTEAYFGANDFYPFVRAELKQYDPQMYSLLQDLWGVDAKQQDRTMRALARLLDSRSGSAASNSAARRKTAPQAKDYQNRNVEGWTVYVHPALVKRKAYGDAICRLLQHKLHLVERYMPEAAVAKLRQVPVYLEQNNPAVPYVTYHAVSRSGDATGKDTEKSGTEKSNAEKSNAEKSGTIEIGNPEAFARWQALQPFMILNQLSRAYYDRVLGDAERKLLEQARRRAVESKEYDSVLRFDGRQVRHPALGDTVAFFAEMTESYYAVNDHFPFLQFEASKHDPETCRLLADLWQGKAK